MKNVTVVALSVGLGVLASGCGQSMATPSGPVVTLADGGVPTWYADVLPIAQRSCQGCHFEGGIAPFALMTYAQAKPMAPSMSGAVSARRMPPWMADPACGGPFIGERILPQSEIDTIVAWNASGAKEGNPADAPPAPDGGVGQLAHVDATLHMAEPYTPSATLTDDYRCFVLDPALTTSQQVIGYDISPGVRAEVHHVIVYVVDRKQAAAEDAKDALPGWQCFGGAGIDTTGPIGAWAPGSGAVVYPKGGISLKANQVLAMQIHYNTTAGTRVPDTSSVKLMYATTPVTDAYLLPLVAGGFAIPPNSTGYSYSKAFPNAYGVPIKVWGLLPHMHTLGKHITMKGGDDTCLVDIPKWDFHWQQTYFRPTAHVLNAGASLTISCEWDNPGSSTIHWGESTSDEMCFAYVYATL